MNNIVIIPARMQATRFPNKPLADISGVAMIVRVMQQAIKADIGDVFVACGDQEIYNCIIASSGNAILTDNDLPSGTDRIYQAFKKIGRDVDGVINVQGDVPTVCPSVIRTVANALNNKGVDMTTACAKIVEQDEITNPNVVKVYADFSNLDVVTATDFNRSAVGDAPFYHHIGIYGYKVSALKKFVSLPPSENEVKRKLEQLRAMDAGMRIDICLVDDVPLGIDTPDDLEKAVKIIAKQG